MKNFVLICIGLLSLVLTTATLAQENSPSPGVDEQKVKDLKEKLATKVAELRETQTRGFFGTISSPATTSFTLVTVSGDIIVRFDENAQILKLADKKTTGKTSDIKTAGSAAVLGIYESDSKQLTSKVIFLQSLPKHFSGEITEIDKKEATVTVKTNKGEVVTFDYEKTTTADEYQTSDKKMAKSGLSRLEVTDRVQIWATQDKDDQQKFLANRLLRLPKELFGGAGTSVSASPSATPKSTPKASPKPSPTP